MFQPIKKLVLIGLALSLSGVAEAQLKHNDFTRRDRRFSSKRFSNETRSPEVNQTLAGRRFARKTYTTPRSSLLQRRAPINLQETRRKTFFKADKVDYPSRGPWKFAPQNRQRASHAFARTRARTRAPSFSGAAVMNLQDLGRYGRQPSPGGTPSLSLQDFNRFQFRSNRSSEPGVPVQRAGSGDGGGGGGGG